MPVDMVTVSSSNISAIGYDHERGDLLVEFRNRWTYRYRSVPLAVYEAFLRAPSKGRYHHAVVRPRYAYSRVR